MDEKKRQQDITINICKLVALELHNNFSCIVTTSLQLNMVPHIPSFVHCNSSNLSNNIHVIKIYYVAMKL